MSANFDLTRKLWHWRSSNALFQKLGAPAATQITGDAEEFPIYGRSEDSRDLIHDLAAQMNFGPAAFRFEIVEDIRDTYGLPYQMQDAPLNVEVLREGAGYAVHIAKSILDSLEFAVAAVYAMAKARLEGAYGLPAGDPEGKLANSFLELAAIHMGYGAFLLRHGTDFKVQDDGLWQRTSRRRTSIPNPEIAYAMAVAFEEADLAKPLALPRPIPSLIRAGLAEYAVDVSNMLPSGIDARRQYRRKMHHKALACGGSRDYASQIKYYEAAYFATPKDDYGAIICNNLGYALLRAGKFAQAVPLFLESIRLAPQRTASRNNLLHCHWLRGESAAAQAISDELESLGLADGRTRLRQALLRMRAGDLAAAERLFAAASEEAESGKPLDMLDYYLSEFYARVGDAARAERHLAKAKALNDIPPKAEA